MKRLVVTLSVVFLFLAVVPESDAFIFRWMRRGRTQSSYSISGNPQQVAYQKAQIQANRGRCFHPGGSFGGCNYEGIGGGRTRQAALNNCCYSGAPGSKGRKRVCVAEAAVQASNGWWFACRLYR
jgi:hypothetical protein